MNAQALFNPIGARWLGETVVCIASGPSLTREDVDLVKVQHAAGRCKVIAVNREFEMAPWADALYIADYMCWQEYMKDINKAFHGERWTIDERAARQFKLNLIGRARGEGFSKDPKEITTGGNSGFQVVHLAMHWGASRIFLLGYDMQQTGGKPHHYGKHRGHLHNGKWFDRWIPSFKPLVAELKRRGVQIVNLSRQTALPDWVPRSTLEEVQW